MATDLRPEEYLIGMDIVEAQLSAQTSLTYTSLRVYTENSAITCEHKPNRLNLEHDSKTGLVTKAYYG